VVRAGCSARTAAERTGITAETAARWVRRFNETGFGSFEAVSKPRSRIPIITGPQIRELIDIALSSPREPGLPYADAPSRMH
jgi:transposase